MIDEVDAMVVKEVVEAAAADIIAEVGGMRMLVVGFAVARERLCLNCEWGMFAAT